MHSLNNKRIWEKKKSKFIPILCFINTTLGEITGGFWDNLRCSSSAYCSCYEKQWRYSLLQSFIQSWSMGIYSKEKKKENTEDEKRLKTLNNEQNDSGLPVLWHHREEVGVGAQHINNTMRATAQHTQKLMNGWMRTALMQYNTSQVNTQGNRQDKTRQDKTRQDKSSQYNTIQCNAMQCNTIRCNTRQ